MTAATTLSRETNKSHFMERQAYSIKRLHGDGVVLNAASSYFCCSVAMLSPASSWLLLSHDDESCVNDFKFGFWGTALVAMFWWVTVASLS